MQLQSTYPCAFSIRIHSMILFASHYLRHHPRSNPIPQDLWRCSRHGPWLGGIPVEFGPKLNLHFLPYLAVYTHGYQFRVDVMFQMWGDRESCRAAVEAIVGSISPQVNRMMIKMRTHSIMPLQAIQDEQSLLILTIW